MDNTNSDLKILIALVAVMLILWSCAGCSHTKSITVQIPAVLDISLEYHDQQDETEPLTVEEIFKE